MPEPACESRARPPQPARSSLARPPGGQSRSRAPGASARPPLLRRGDRVQPRCPGFGHLPRERVATRR